MLRNGLSHVRDGVPGFLLNEVLSLNAQELLKGLDAGRRARSSMKS